MLNFIIIHVVMNLVVLDAGELEKKTARWEDNEYTWTNICSGTI